MKEAAASTAATLLYAPLPPYTRCRVYIHTAGEHLARFLPFHPTRWLASFLPSFLRFASQTANRTPRGNYGYILSLAVQTPSSQSWLNLLSVQRTIAGNLNEFSIYIYIYGIIMESSNNQFPSCGEMSGKMQGFET